MARKKRKRQDKVKMKDLWEALDMADELVLAVKKALRKRPPEEVVTDALEVTYPLDRKPFYVGGSCRLSHRVRIK